MTYRIQPKPLSPEALEALVPLCQKRHNGAQEAFAAGVLKLISAEINRLRFIFPATVLFEDLQSECMVKVLESLSKFDPARGRILPWVYKVLQNTLITLARRENKYAASQKSLTPEERDSLEDDKSSPDFDRLEKLGEAFTVVERLPERIRIIILARAAGAGWDIIARNLRVQPRYAQYLMYTTLRQVRKEIRSKQVKDGFNPAAGPRRIGRDTDNGGK